MMELADCLNSKELCEVFQSRSERFFGGVEKDRDRSPSGERSSPSEGGSKRIVGD